MPQDFNKLAATKASTKENNATTEDLSETTLGGIEDVPVPAIVAAQIFGDAERALYQIAYLKAKASGLSDLECVNSAFVTVTGARTRTQFGTTVSGENITEGIGYTPTPNRTDFGTSKAFQAHSLVKAAQRAPQDLTQIGQRAARPLGYVPGDDKGTR